jgi:hypothetical protein
VTPGTRVTHRGFGAGCVLEEPEPGRSIVAFDEYGVMSGPTGIIDSHLSPETTEPGGNDLFADDVAAKAYDLRVLDAARAAVAAERAGAAPPFDAGTLAEVLARPAEPPFRVAELIPSAGATLVIAQRKTGKTTLVLNLARCLLTGEQFLGRFDVRKLDGSIGLLNFEVSAAQVARWAGDAQVPDDRMLLANLRGRRNPLAYADDRAALAAKLREHEVECLIVDPFGRAYTGASQNDAGEVGAFLADLDTFARTEVGCSDLILTAHAGWNGERSRGSTALEDWGDSILTMTRDDEGERFLRAEGRDVELDEDQLHFDATTRRLTLSGRGSRKLSAGIRQVEAQMPAVLDLLRDDGPKNGNELDRALAAIDGLKHSKGDGARAANLLTKRGLVESTPGPRNSTVFSVSSLSSLNLPQGKSGTSLTPLKGREVTQGEIDLDETRGKS